MFERRGRAAGEAVGVRGGGAVAGTENLLRSECFQFYVGHGVAAGIHFDATAVVCIVGAGGARDADSEVLAIVRRNEVGASLPVLCEPAGLRVRRIRFASRWRKAAGPFHGPA